MLTNYFSEKPLQKEKIAHLVISQPALLNELFDGLNSSKADIKFGCEKILRLISEVKPELLYPHFNFFIELLNHKNNFLKRGAIFTLSNLTNADSENMFDKIFKKYFSTIKGPTFITAANTINAASTIAKAKPELTEKIAKEILKVEKAKYESEECLNIAKGHSIESFAKFFNQIKNKKPVIEFVKKQLKNSRPAVRKKAEKFLRKVKAD